MKLNKLSKADLAIIAEAEAMNASGNYSDAPMFGQTDPEAPETIAEDNVIEALEEANETTTETPVDVVSFDTLTAQVSDEDAVQMAIAVGKAIDERTEFENVKGNGTILKHLEKSRKQLATPRAGRVLIACNVDPAMINRTVHEGARYNVYALGKLADAINALSGGVLGNAINQATMKSMFQFRAAGHVFNGEMAKACVSDKIRVEAGLRGMLIRHTCSVSTASTQASSTMQALTTLGIVSRSGSQKNPTYNLTSAPVVAKLEEVLKAA